MAASMLGQGRADGALLLEITKGDVVGSKAGKINHVMDPLQAEETACIKALEAAQMWGMTNVSRCPSARSGT